MESFVWAGWTIGVEMPFYCLLPVIMLTIRSLQSALWFSAAALTVSVVARITLASDHLPSHYATMALISNIGIFSIGVAAFYVVRSVRRSTAVAVCIVGFLAAAGLLLFGLGTGYFPTFLYSGFPEMPPLAIGLGMLCIWQVKAPSRWLRSGVMQWVGEHSFSVYLVHPLVITLLNANGFYLAIDGSMSPDIGAWSYLLDGAATATIVLAVSTVTYRWIEVPGQRIGRILMRERIPTSREDAVVAR
jgi:peptidoglycan/LPS O-acetylase OafA/YrhL